MRMTTGLVSAAALALFCTAAHAERVGPYVSVFGGYTNPWNDKNSLNLDDGFGLGAAVGYDFGWPRIEGEVSYQRSSAKGRGGHFGVLAAMLNAYLDIETGTRITPYVGGGVGVARLHADDIGNVTSLTDSNYEIAWQAIGGVKFAVTDALALFVDYRFFDTGLARFTDAGAPRLKTDATSHNVFAGLSYNFGSSQPPAPPMVEAVTPPPTPAPELARSYIVFFDWNSTAITPEADAIIHDAANAASSLGVARIELTGHADRSGSAAYNQKLSVRRAEAVKAVLVGLGVAPEQITTVGKGETAPLVPTPDGVREPQNRRVEIVL